MVNAGMLAPVGKVTVVNPVPVVCPHLSNIPEGSLVQPGVAKVPDVNSTTEPLLCLLQAISGLPVNDEV